MPYDEELAHRVREQLAGQEGVSEMRMFGGLAFLVNGNMSVAVSTHGGLLVRVAPERTEALLAKPHASLAQMGKRQMRGWLRVAPEGVRSKRDLATWVKRGADHASSLPPKAGRRARPRR